MTPSPTGDHVGANGPPTPGGHLTPVPVGEIEAELARRWDVAAAQARRQRLHSAALTLIACVEEEQDHQKVIDAVEALAGKHPLRAIALHSASSIPKGTVEAWIGTGCSGADGSVPVCSEEIVLEANAGEAERAISAVRSLLVPDLPVFLWWRSCSPLGAVLFEQLEPLCSRIIVDSLRFGDGAHALVSMREIVERFESRLTVRDLNWQRTEPWRNAIGVCFDDPLLLQLLPAFDRCSVTFAADAGTKVPSARSLLMAGWLTTRLAPLRGNCTVAPGKHWADIEPGRVFAISLTSSTSKASLVLVRETKPTAIKAEAHRADGSRFRSWLFPAATLAEASLLDRCMDTLGRDRLFEAAVTAAA